MASGSGKIVDQVERLDEDFRTLVEMVTGPDAMECTAAKMELRIFREVLAPECVKPRGTDDARISECILVPSRRLTDDQKRLAIA